MMMVMPGMEEETGVVDYFHKGNATKPCDECILKYAHAELYFTDEDETPANLDNGVWLHHMTLSAEGPEDRVDLFCPAYQDGERFLVVHNDRNATTYGLSGADPTVGFPVRKDDKWTMILELKNEKNIEQEVYYDLIFEFIPGPAPKEGFTEVKGVWMDAQKCGSKTGSEIYPPADEDVFTLESKKWVSPYNGRWISSVGHMHEGATCLELLSNGEPLCESHAVYGDDPAYKPTPESLALGVMDLPHVTHYTSCLDFGKLSKGDEIELKAHYNFTKHEPAVGETAPFGVMGIALSFFTIED